MATPAQAAKALQDYRRALPAAILRGLRNGLRVAEGLVKKKYLVRGTYYPGSPSKGQRLDPPNPPPGPLKIRSGRLVRTIRISDIRFNGRQIIGGLQAGDSQVRYARIHELGGYAGRGRRTLIRPRPYLRPAMVEARPLIERAIAVEMLRVAKLTLAGIARVRTS